MAIELLAKNIEVGLVTTNLDAMVGFYETFLGLPYQGDLDFPGGTMKRYSLGDNVLKLVTLDEPPASAAVPGGGPAQAGIRYFTVVVANVTTAAEQVREAIRGETLWVLPHEDLKPLVTARAESIVQGRNPAGMSFG